MCFSGGAILAYVVTDGRLFSHKTGVWLTLLGHRGILLRRVAHGRKIAMQPLLFPGYVFVCIISRGHAARWMPGVVGFVMGGECPARVPGRRDQRA
jgi:transcription antitermination factor NusG